MIESLINLYGQLAPNQAQEVIDSAWSQLNLLYKNKSIIHPLIQVYINSTDPFYKVQSLYGINSCLVQSYIHFNQTELFTIANKMVEIYLCEEENFFKIISSQIICYLIDRIRQTWPQLNHLIFHFKASSPSYLKIFFYYSILFPNTELILLKVDQSFEYDLQTKLRGIEILLFFIEDQKIIFDSFSLKIQEVVNLIFLSNKIECFDTFLQIYARYFSVIYSYCPIFAFISNLTNYDLHPSILISIRDFLNSYLIEMIESQYKISGNEYENKNLFYQEIMMQIFTQEISLSIQLFSIEIDEMTTTSGTFRQIIKFIPKEIIEKTISDLMSSDNIPSIITSITLFTAFAQLDGGSEMKFNLFLSYLNINNDFVRKLTIDSLYELRKDFKGLYSISLIEFLMDWIEKLKVENKNDPYLIHHTFNQMIQLLEEINDISLILDKLFIFGIKILSDGKEIEIEDVLFLFDYIISNNQTTNENVTNFYIQILQIALQIVDRINVDEILVLSYDVLASLLLKDKMIFVPYLDVILQNFSNVYSLKFISVLLVYFEEKVSSVIQQNIQKIIEICDNETDNPLRILYAFETEVTLFLYYNGQIKISSSILKLFFNVIQKSSIEMHQSVKNTTNSLFQCLSVNDKEFDPNSLTPLLLNLLGVSLETDQLIIEIIVLIFEIYRNCFNTVLYFEYTLNQLESIFQSKKINAFESILICFCDFYSEIIELLDDVQIQEVIPKLTQFAFPYLNSNNQIVCLVCMRIFLYCEKKIIIQDSIVIEKVVNFLNDVVIEDKKNNLCDEICCTAAHFINIMILKDPENTIKFSQLIVDLSITKLSTTHDQELSENLIFILINLNPFYEQDEKIISLILSHFPLRIDQSLFERCYDWLIKILNNISDEIKLLAYRSIIQFMVCDIKQFYEDEDISNELLVALFSVISSLSQQFVSESLNNDANLLKVFISHVNYVSSILKQSE